MYVYILWFNMSVFLEKRFNRYNILNRYLCSESFYVLTHMYIYMGYEFHYIYIRMLPYLAFLLSDKKCFLKYERIKI